MKNYFKGKFFLLLIFSLLCTQLMAVGQEIVYVSRKDGTSDIWVINSDGSFKKNISSISHDPLGLYIEEEPKWSPDGQQIVFRSNKSGVYNIWIMNSDGTGDYNLTESSLAEQGPCWCPDGTKIYFARNTKYSSGKGCSPCPYWEIYVIDLITMNETRLTFNNYREMSPRVSPDGTKIAYVKSERPFDCCNPTDIWIMNSDGSNQNLLIGQGDWKYEWVQSWGRFNNKILFSKQFDCGYSWCNEIVYIDPDNPMDFNRVTINNVGDWPCAFSPDGQKILFATNRTGNFDLFIIDIMGIGEPVPLTNEPWDELYGDWKSSHSLKVLFDDFNYTSVDELIGTSKWKTPKGEEYKDMYYYQGKKERINVIFENENNSFLELNLLKGDEPHYIDEEEVPTGPSIGTIDKFNKGVYAARIWFDDDPYFNESNVIKRDKIVETFWIQTPSYWKTLEKYAECDFEYLPNDFWNSNKKNKEERLPRMYIVTWEYVKGKKDDRNLIKPPLEMFLGERWVTLMIKVDPEKFVEYIIFDELNNKVESIIEDNKKYVPEIESAMQMLVGIWNKKVIKNGDYKIRVDWWMHIQDDISMELPEVTSLVNKFRKVDRISRIDTTEKRFFD